MNRRRSKRSSLLFGAQVIAVGCGGLRLRVDLAAATAAIAALMRAGAARLASTGCAGPRYGLRHGDDVLRWQHARCASLGGGGGASGEAWGQASRGTARTWCSRPMERSPGFVTRSARGRRSSTRPNATRRPARPSPGSRCSRRGLSLPRRGRRCPGGGPGPGPRQRQSPRVTRFEVTPDGGLYTFVWQPTSLVIEHRATCSFDEAPRRVARIDRALSPDVPAVVDADGTLTVALCNTEHGGVGPEPGIREPGRRGAGITEGFGTDLASLGPRNFLLPSPRGLWFVTGGGRRTISVYEALLPRFARLARLPFILSAKTGDQPLAACPIGDQLAVVRRQRGQQHRRDHRRRCRAADRWRRRARIRRRRVDSAPRLARGRRAPVCIPRRRRAVRSPPRR